MCVGVFVWIKSRQGVLESCVEEVRSEAVGTFMKRLIEKEQPLFFHVSVSCLSPVTPLLNQLLRGQPIHLGGKQASPFSRAVLNEPNDVACTKCSGRESLKKTNK